MAKRYTMFKPNKPKNDDVTGISPGSPVKLYTDESGNGNADQPLIVGAVVTDIDADEIEAQVETLYRRLKARRELQGFKSFDDFCRKGFHAASDPPEVSVPFFELIQQQMGFKVFIVMTDRCAMPDASEQQQIEYMYELMLSDNLIRYRGHPELLCYIEQNDALRGLAGRLPPAVEARARTKLGHGGPLPALKIRMMAKQASMSIAIIDYVMMAVSRWARIGYRRDLSAHEYRTFRQVEPTISVLYSLELGVLSNRRARVT